MADNTAELRRQVEALGPWFHNLHLPGGVQTVPDHFIGGDFPSFKWQQIRDSIPQDLSGWRVLDVGCNAGFYSFELARRGASVTAIDVEELYLAQAKWAAKQFGLQDRVEFRQQQVYDLARSSESFDLVWFMGVFYHLRYPLLALDLLAQRARRMMVFQTLSMPGEEVYPDTLDHPITEREPLLDPGWPKMAFIEHRFSGDPTNWWVPNHAGIEAMLRSSGLRVTTRPAEEIYVCVPNPDTAAWRRDTQMQSALGLARAPLPASTGSDTRSAEAAPA
jgi:tRNA (mo5U34)-methyltransferase